MSFLHFTRARRRDTSRHLLRSARFHERSTHKNTIATLKIAISERRSRRGPERALRSSIYYRVEKQNSKMFDKRRNKMAHGTTGSRRATSGIRRAIVVFTVVFLCCISSALRSYVSGGRHSFQRLDDVDVSSRRSSPPPFDAFDASLRASLRDARLRKRLEDYNLFHTETNGASEPAGTWTKTTSNLRSRARAKSVWVNKETAGNGCVTRVSSRKSRRVSCIRSVRITNLISRALYWIRFRKIARFTSSITPSRRCVS